MLDAERARLLHDGFAKAKIAFELMENGRKRVSAPVKEAFAALRAARYAVGDGFLVDDAIGALQDSVDLYASGQMSAWTNGGQVYEISDTLERASCVGMWRAAREASLSSVGGAGRCSASLLEEARDPGKRILGAGFAAHAACLGDACGRDRRAVVEIANALESEPMTRWIGVVAYELRTASEDRAA